MNKNSMEKQKNAIFKDERCNERRMMLTIVNYYNTPNEEFINLW